MMFEEERPHFVSHGEFRYGVLYPERGYGYGRDYGTNYGAGNGCGKKYGYGNGQGFGDGSSRNFSKVNRGDGDVKVVSGALFRNNPYYWGCGRSFAWSMYDGK
jgi:hypothetical protein